MEMGCICSEVGAYFLYVILITFMLQRGIKSVDCGMSSGTLTYMKIGFR